MISLMPMKRGRVERAVSAQGARLAQAAMGLDRAFVALACTIEDAFLAAAQGVSERAVSIIPRATRKATKILTRVSQQTEGLSDSSSVVLASVPAAATRTAALITRLGRASAGAAKQNLAVLFAARQTAAEHKGRHFRDIGSSVATHVREGLDSMPLAKAIDTHVRELRVLDKGSRTAGKYGAAARAAP